MAEIKHKICVLLFPTKYRQTSHSIIECQHDYNNGANSLQSTTEIQYIISPSVSNPEQAAAKCDMHHHQPTW